MRRGAAGDRRRCRVRARGCRRRVRRPRSSSSHAVVEVTAPGADTVPVDRRRSARGRSPARDRGRGRARRAASVVPDGAGTRGRGRRVRDADRGRGGGSARRGIGRESRRRRAASASPRRPRSSRATPPGRCSSTSTVPFDAVKVRPVRVRARRGVRRSRSAGIPSIAHNSPTDVEARLRRAEQRRACGQAASRRCRVRPPGTHTALTDDRSPESTTIATCTFPAAQARPTARPPSGVANANATSAAPMKARDRRVIDRQRHVRRRRAPPTNTQPDRDHERGDDRERGRRRPVRGSSLLAAGATVDPGAVVPAVAIVVPVARDGRRRRRRRGRHRDARTAWAASTRSSRP